MAQERDAQPTDGRSSFRSTLSSLLARSPPAGRGGTRLPTLQQRVSTAHPASKTCGTRTTCSTLLCTLVALACTLHRMRTASVASSPAIASRSVTQARTKRRRQPPFMNKNNDLAPSTKVLPNHNPTIIAHAGKPSFQNVAVRAHTTPVVSAQEYTGTHM